MHYMHFLLIVFRKIRLKRRLENIEAVRREVRAWQRYRNNKNAKIKWQFTTKDARIKLSGTVKTFV